MNAPLTLVPRSSLGSKFLMALTGLGLTLFVIAHMLGNFQVFVGREALNGYAATLKHTPGLLWPARAGLLTVFVLHVVYGVKLWVARRAHDSPGRRSPDRDRRRRRGRGWRAVPPERSHARRRDARVARHEVHPGVGFARRGQWRVHAHGDRARCCRQHDRVGRDSSDDPQLTAPVRCSARRALKHPAALCCGYATVWRGIGAHLQAPPPGLAMASALPCPRPASLAPPNGAIHATPWPVRTA